MKNGGNIPFLALLLLFAGFRPGFEWLALGVLRTLRLSSLSCGDEALEADGVLICDVADLFNKYFGFFNR